MFIICSDIAKNIENNIPQIIDFLKLFFLRKSYLLPYLFQYRLSRIWVNSEHKHFENCHLFISDG